MTVTAIQIGLDPDAIDYSSADFAQFAGLSKEKLRTANKLNVAGLRLVAGNTLLFEAIVNAAHVAQPDCRFVFNRAAMSTPDDIRRWYPNPAAVA
jgi:hypothetical protein